MPTYAYACTECDHRFEVVQSFDDDSLTVCPECGGRLRKVFNAVGIVFKGGGFYRTDSRSGSSEGGSAGSGGSGGSGSGPSESTGSSSSETAGATAGSASGAASSGSASTASKPSTAPSTASG